MKKVITISFLLIALLTLLGLPIFNKSVKAKNEDFVSGQILVKFKSGTSQEDKNKQLENNKAKVK